MFNDFNCVLPVLNCFLCLTNYMPIVISLVIYRLNQFGSIGLAFLSKSDLLESVYNII